MKFGKEFKKQKVPEWIEAYVDYNGLKRVLQELREFKQSKGPSTPARTSQQKSSLLRPFSGLDVRKSFDETKEDDIENQVIAVETVHKDDNREEYSTNFLMPTQEGEVVRDRCNANCCAYDLKLKQVNCERCCGHTIHYTPHIGLAILFHIFGFYWVTQFVKAFSSTVIAGSVASHYWAHGEVLLEISFLPILSSVKRLVRYNIGSVAIGSLIVSFVESSSRILKPLRRKLMVVDVRTHDWVGKALSVSSHYALVCVEWIIRSVNHNAYIMIAITGESFFTASAMATDLIKSNILRIGKVNVIGNVILLQRNYTIRYTSSPPTPR